MTTPVISFKHVSKHFTFWRERPNSIKTLLVNTLKRKSDFGTRQKVEVLRDLSFDIGRGEFVGIMGRNGAGKSTILKLICGIYKPSSGEITVGDGLAPLIELGAGFHPDLSGFENIFLNAAVLGFGRKASMAALKEIVEFSELGEHIEMPVKNYSSGMLVRLGFSIATHLPAPILLVDEVLAVGDIGFQEKCIRKIKELHKSGRTIVFITHSPESVAAHCTRCIVIDGHRKVHDGDAKLGSQIYTERVRLH